jgi:hypothetical protein
VNILPYTHIMSVLHEIEITTVDISTRSFLNDA